MELLFKNDLLKTIEELSNKYQLTVDHVYHILSELTLNLSETYSAYQQQQIQEYQKQQEQNNQPTTPPES